MNELHSKQVGRGLGDLGPKVDSHLNKFKQVHEIAGQGRGVPIWVVGLGFPSEQVLYGHMGEFTWSFIQRPTAHLPIDALAGVEWSGEL